MKNKMIKLAGVGFIVVLMFLVVTGGSAIPDGRMVSVEAKLVKPAIGETYIEYVSYNVGGGCNTAFDIKPMFFHAVGNYKIMLGGKTKTARYDIDYDLFGGSAIYEDDMGCYKYGSYQGKLYVYHADGRVLDYKEFTVEVSE